MTGRTHGVWGMAAGAGAALSLGGLPGVGWGLHLVGILLGGLAALVPDLDTEESLLFSLPVREGRRTKSLVLALLGYILSLALRVIGGVVRMFTKHREATHSLLALMVGSAVVGILSSAVGAAVLATQTRGEIGSALLLLPRIGIWQQALYIAAVSALGWGSHLLLDALTEGGVPLWYPLSKKHLRLLRLHTGGPADNFLQVVGSAALGTALLLYAIRWGERLGWLRTR